MVKFPAYSKPVWATNAFPYQHISFFPIIYRALQSEKKCIIFVFKRQKRLAEIGLPHYQVILQEQEQRGSPRSVLSTQTPPGTPPPSAAAGPHTNLCPGIKVAR